MAREFNKARETHLKNPLASRFAALALALSIAFAAGQADAGQNATYFKLDNGLEVVVVPDRLVLRNRREAIEATRECADDSQLCAAWGKAVHADLDNQCANFGPLEFVGCIGARAAAASS